MCLHGPLSNSQRRPYLLIRLALDQQVQDFFFPTSKGLASHRCTAKGAAAAINEHRNNSPGRPYEALSHDADCLRQLLHGRSFIDIALRTANKCVESKVVTNVGPCNHNL